MTIKTTYKIFKQFVEYNDIFKKNDRDTEHFEYRLNKSVVIEIANDDHGIKDQFQRWWNEGRGRSTV